MIMLIMSSDNDKNGDRDVKRIRRMNMEVIRGNIVFMNNDVMRIMVIKVEGKKL